MLLKNRLSLKPAVRPVIESLEHRRLMSGTLTLVNPDGLPGSDRLIFNVIENLDPITPNTTTSMASLQLENTGSSTLTINTITASGPFSLVNPPPAGVGIPVGGSLELTVKFTQTSLPAHAVNETNYTSDPNGGAGITGSLTITSSDTDAPVKTVSLAGYWQNSSENNNEPNLTTLVNSIAGYKTDISNPYAVDLTESSTPQLYGSEIYSSTWTTADPSAPVTLQTLAEFHTEGNIVHTYWYTSNSAGSIDSRLLTTSIPDQGQMLLPDSSGPQDPGGLATATFNPTGDFGFRVDNEYSNDSLNVAAGNAGGGGHHFRFYPLVDSAGNAVPNTYVVAMDYAIIQTENFDFQDNVFIVSNIRPTTAPPAPTNLVATSAAQPVLSWTPVTYSALGGYDVYRATSSTGTYSLLTGTPISAATYTDNTAIGGVELFYRVTAIDSNSTLQSQPATTTANTPGGPFAVADAVNAYSGQPTPISVLANDTDATGAIDPATVAIFAQPNHGGSVAINPNTGVITYTSSAGFSGTETFSYTERDDNGALSATPAKVTVTVINPQTISPTAYDDSAVVLANSAVNIDVLANDQAATTLVPTSVVIGHASSHGTTAVNADGSITYTPAANFVGSDSFTYTVTDANGRVSSSSTVGINVGVQITNAAKTGTKSVNYTDGDATPVVITLTRGAAAVYFNGTGTESIARGGKIVIAGSSGLSVSNIALANTTAASTLNITSKLGTVNVKGITDAGTIGTINAKTTNFTGVLQVGGLSALTLKNETVQSSGNPTLINIGGGISHGPTLQFATVADTSVNSSVPIRSLRATAWLNTVSDTISISAPSMANLTVAGEFDPTLNLTATGNSTLGSAIIRGSLGTGYWSIAGTARNVNIAKAGNSWGASFGTINSLTIRGGGLSNDLTAKTIGTLNITGDLTAGVTATTARSIRVNGAVTGADLDFTAPVGKAAALGSLIVTGAVTESSITTNGNVNSITAGALEGTSILLDTAATSVADASTGNIGTATLRSLVVRSRAASAFSDSNVVADEILVASTGSVDPVGTPEGLAAKIFKSVTIGNTRLPTSELTSASSLSAYLASKAINFGTFTIDVVPAA